MTEKLKIYAEGGIHYIDSDISGWKCVRKVADFIAIPLQKGDHFPGFIPDKINRYRGQEVWSFRDELFGVVNGVMTIVYHLGTGQMISACQTKDGAFALTRNRLSEYEDFQILYDMFKKQLTQEHIAELKKYNDRSMFIYDRRRKKDLIAEQLDELRKKEKELEQQLLEEEDSMKTAAEIAMEKDTGYVPHGLSREEVLRHILQFFPDWSTEGIEFNYEMRKPHTLTDAELEVLYWRLQ